MSRADIRQQMEKAFAQLDKNNDESVCRDELRPLLVTVFGKGFPDEYLDIIMSKADKNGTGTVDTIDELVDALYSIKAVIICSRLAVLLDENRDGYVTREELESKLERCEHPVVRDLIQDAPMDGRGQISCDDFFGFVLQKLM